MKWMRGSKCSPSDAFWFSRFTDDCWKVEEGEQEEEKQEEEEEKSRCMNLPDFMLSDCREGKCGAVEGRRRLCEKGFLRIV